MTPIIFTHYGNTDYLYYTIQCAKRNCPNSPVVLIGDQDNESLAKELDIQFYNLNSFDSEMISDFNKNYISISGQKHIDYKNGKDWLKYVFLRWFIIDSLLEDLKIKEFWHFDSDTMILEDLTKHQVLFQNYDCTEQCLGNCMNGFIKSRIVTDYCNYILEMFKDTHLVDLNNLEFSNYNKNMALTEMRAFQYFKNKKNVKSTSLNINKETFFDNAFRFSEGFETSLFYDGKPIKKLIHLDGTFYLIRNGNYIKLITANLSWLPIEFYVFFHETMFANSELQINEFLEKEIPYSKKLKFSLKKILKI